MNFNWMARTPAGTAVDQKPAIGSTATQIQPAKRTRVAFLGGLASYSHQAALETFDNDTTEFDPKIGFEDIFSAVQNSSADFGVIPLENSTNGSVVPTFDLFCDRVQQFPAVLICGEKYLDVRHCLLGFTPPTGTLTSSISAIRLSDIAAGDEDSPNSTPKPQARAKPLVSLAHVQRVYSHPQAFGQCEAFLGRYLRGIERMDASSTTKAAEIVSKDTSGTSVAIASKIASQVHKVKILASDIEDREDNTTRFMIVRRATTADVSRAMDSKDPESFYWSPPSPKQPFEHGDLPSSPSTGVETRTKSMVSFTVDHRSPGALAEALLVFKTHGLNLTSIVSRPSRTVAWNYIFLIEFEGSRFEDAGKDGPVAAALRDLDSVAKDWRWIGSWRDQLRYR